MYTIGQTWSGPIKVGSRLLSYILRILQKILSLSPDGGCQGQEEEHPQGYATKPIEILHCHLHYNRYPLMAATHTWIA